MVVGKTYETHHRNAFRTAIHPQFFSLNARAAPAPLQWFGNF